MFMTSTKSYILLYIPTLPYEPGICSHRIEYGVLVTEKVARRVKLYNTASVKDHDAADEMMCVNYILKHVTATTVAMGMLSQAITSIL